VASGLATNESVKGKKVQAKELPLDELIKSFVAEPITPRDQLAKNRNDMKTRMELLIMKIQVIILDCFLFPIPCCFND